MQQGAEAVMETGIETRAGGRVEAIAVKRAREGDAEAFRMIVEQHSHNIFRLAFRITANEADAEDVVQETLLRAYRSLGRYDTRARFGTWLHSIASNCAIDLLRKKKHRRTEDLDRIESGPAAPVSAGPGPEREAMSGQLRARVDSELSRLTPRERVAFSLRHFEGMSIREIAEITDSPEGSIKNQIFRAVRKLRAALRPALEQGADR